MNKVVLWIPRRAPNLNDLMRAKSTVFGKGKKRSDAYAQLKLSWAGTVALCSASARLASRSSADSLSLPLDTYSAHFDIVEPDKKRDPDNIAAGSFKLILDGLVRSGVVAGDGWKHITGLSFSWRVGRIPGVRVVLTPGDLDG